MGRTRRGLRRPGLRPRGAHRRAHRRGVEVLRMGFLPGFAYLGPLPASLTVPRRSTPRAKVPAGSVALAGSRTGVYPFASPGGWNLLGRTLDLPLFDPAHGPRWRVGDRVRFEPA
ncbi:MAG: carboxyltransferase domain-containing protein [Polyangiales bacterium]